MGSRAIVIVCRDEDSARARFGVQEGSGIIYTRTGRRFFEDEKLENAVLGKVRGAPDRTGMWGEFGTDWFCLDCEIMPWSAKARDLLRGQYAAVGAAARPALSEVVNVLEVAKAANGPDIVPLLQSYRERKSTIEPYVEVYRRYSWPVETAADLKLAPFPPARHRRDGTRGQGPSLAHGEGREALRGRR